MADETVVVRESDLADRLGLGPEAIRSVAQQRVDAGAWEMWTDEAGETVFEIPVSDLADDQAADQAEAPAPTPRSIRRSADGAGSSGAPVNADEAASGAAAPDDPDEPDPHGDPAMAAPPQPSGTATDPAADGDESVEDLSDPGDAAADLREAFRQVTEQRDTLQQEVDRLSEERDALQAERDTLRSERDTSRQTAEQARDADANLKLKRDALQAEVDRLRGKPLRRLLARLLGRPRA